MAYDEYRERGRFDRDVAFERGEYSPRRTSEFGPHRTQDYVPRRTESRWPDESSWGYGREYDEGRPERPAFEPTRSFEGEGRPDLTGGATEFHPETTRRYPVGSFGGDFGWQAQGGYGQGAGYLYGWSAGEQGLDTRSYRTPERWRTEPRISSDWWNQPGEYYGTSRHLATIPRGRFTGRGPRGYQRSDERIREDVNEELFRSGEIDASNIEVTVANCVVTLEGEVEDRDQKRLAEDIVEAAPGVRDVRNNLKVKRGCFARLFGTDEEETRSEYPGRESR
jgi:osmotically-inducible protein OsmY